MARYSVTFLPFNPTLPSDTRVDFDVLRSSLATDKYCYGVTPYIEHITTYIYRGPMYHQDVTFLSETVFVSLNEES